MPEASRNQSDRKASPRTAYEAGRVPARLRTISDGWVLAIAYWRRETDRIYGLGTIGP
jgi:hypothetical protein